MEIGDRKEQGKFMSLKRDDRGWIFLKGKSGYQGIDIKMLQHNKIQGFLNLQIRHIDENCFYYYDASGMCSLKDYLDGKQADYKTIRGIYRDIAKIYRNCQEYFLQEKNCILQPEYLFWNGRKGEWRGCYVPDFGRNPQEQLEELNQFLLQKINHKDKQCVKFIYGIYERIQQEGDYLEGIEGYIRGFAAEEEKIKERKDVRRERTKRKRKQPTFYLKKVTPCYGIPELVEITSSDFRVGRLEENDLVLPMAQISRRHARITVERSRLYIYDCQSTNGVSVNGKKIAGNQEVSCQEKDVISFGNISYKIQR